MLMTLVSDTNDLQLSYSMRDIQRSENALLIVGEERFFICRQKAGIKKPAVRGWFFWDYLVGTRGFEPPTPDTP